MNATTEVGNPWLSMWTRPRATIQSIVDTNPEKDVLLLASISGVSRALNKASINNLADTGPLSMVFVAAIGGVVSGVVGLYIFGFLLRHSAYWIGGNANAEKTRAAIAWSSVPVAWGMLIWLPQVALFGRELFSASTPRMDASPFTVLGLGMLELGVGVWAMILFFKAIGQVNGFSAWRGLASFLIAVALVLVPILAFAFALRTLV